MSKPISIIIAARTASYIAVLDYTHNNPVERGYVDDLLHWRYSSARDYAGQQGLVDVVTDWM
jgi:hypothetical protein